MKCLSLWQPWATLLVSGHKRVETRGWPTRHRGPLLVHAAKLWNADLSRIAYSEPFFSALLASAATSDSWQPKDLPFGAIVGRVDVVECYRTETVEPTDADVRALGKTLEITATERAFGDYSPGRFAFLCRNPVQFPEPIPYRGARGLFDVPDPPAGVA